MSVQAGAHSPHNSRRDGSAVHKPASGNLGTSSSWPAQHPTPEPCLLLAGRMRPTPPVEGEVFSAGYYVVLGQDPHATLTDPGVAQRVAFLPASTMSWPPSRHRTMASLVRASAGARNNMTDGATSAGYLLCQLTAGTQIVLDHEIMLVGAYDSNVGGFGGILDGARHLRVFLPVSPDAREHPRPVDGCTFVAVPLTGSVYIPSSPESGKLPELWLPQTGLESAVFWTKPQLDPEALQWTMCVFAHRPCRGELACGALVRANPESAEAREAYFTWLQDRLTLWSHLDVLSIDVAFDRRGRAAAAFHLLVHVQAAIDDTTVGRKFDYPVDAHKKMRAVSKYMDVLIGKKHPQGVYRPEPEADANSYCLFLNCSWEAAVPKIRADPEAPVLVVDENGWVFGSNGGRLKFDRSGLDVTAAVDSVPTLYDAIWKCMPSLEYGIEAGYRGASGDDSGEDDGSPSDRGDASS
ncbi:hypothetical protein Rhopal_001830-T1 [Rhodotorula paludigena]|uniref:Uncharacterized protein n=1 Tax=Rhodotorula paludigena TaxID=86838 RepID=A0AAV5GG62_9BASI|nr:hypothetical protein Rhopal_001830-T1 [Rhodotorula paludigena]